MNLQFFDFDEIIKLIENQKFCAMATLKPEFNYIFFALTTQSVLHLVLYISTEEIRMYSRW